MASSSINNQIVSSSHSLNPEEWQMVPYSSPSLNDPVTSSVDHSLRPEEWQLVPYEPMVSSSKKTLVDSYDPSLKPKDWQLVLYDPLASSSNDFHSLQSKEEERKVESIMEAEEFKPKTNQSFGLVGGNITGDVHRKKIFRPDKCCISGNIFSTEEKEKFQRYDSELQRYMMYEYFSDKNIYGGNIYDIKLTSSGETFKASRLPPLASFADPAKFWDLMQKEDKEAKTDGPGKEE